jgi:cell division protein FtsB
MDFIEQRFTGEYRQAVERSDEMQRQQIAECAETNTLTEQKLEAIENQARYRLSLIWQHFYNRHTTTV